MKKNAAVASRLTTPIQLPTPGSPKAGLKAATQDQIGKAAIRSTIRSRVAPPIVPGRKVMTRQAPVRRVAPAVTVGKIHTAIAVKTTVIAADASALAVRSVACTGEEPGPAALPLLLCPVLFSASP